MQQLVYHFRALVSLTVMKRSRVDLVVIVL